MNRQPQGIYRGPLHTMALMFGNQHVVTCLQGHCPSIIEDQGGLALHQHHPFIVRLVIPKTFEAGLAMRDDTLNFHARILMQRVEGFLGGVGL